MKIICVDNIGYKKYLTIDKIYETNNFDDFKSIVYVIDDTNNIATYNKELFRKLDEYRKNKIDKLLE